MRSLRYQTEMLIRDGNPYVPVTAAQAAKLKAGWRKPMPVKIRINGAPKEAWRINMMPAGDGSFYLYLHGTVRKASQTAVGDVVLVEVTFDAAYRSGPAHPMPKTFAAGLNAQPTAKKNWEALIPSRQKELLRYLAALKSDEARRRNIERALEVLSGKAGRFMARSWKHGK